MRFAHRASLLAVLSTTAAAWVQGCSSPTPDPVGAAVDGHTAGAIVGMNDPHVWVEASEADFGKGIGMRDVPPVPRTDATTVRMNQWLDRYHTIATDMLAARGVRLAAPKPTAALYKQGSPNAWVAPALACPTWTLNAAAPDGGSTTGATFFLSNNAARVGDLTERCVQPQNWTTPSAFVSFWNGLSPACTVVANGTDLTLGGTSCNVVGTQGALATWGVASTIGVTLEMISWADEIRAATTLAHELGHYYRAHSSPTRKRLGFFYEDTPDGPTLPVPVADSARYEEIVSDARRFPSPIRLPSKTRYSKRLAKVLVAVKPLCEAAQLDDAALTALSFGNATAAQGTAYLAFEAAIATCAESLSLSDEATRTSFVQALRAQSISDHYTKDAGTIAEALAILTSKLDGIDADAKALLAQLNTGALGWYTDEQEADELSLELAARAGFTPDAQIAARVRSHELSDAAAKANNYKSTDLVDAATCKAWLAADFTEVDPYGVSHPIRVPIGSIADTHHESCYRTYNLWREARKHTYEVAKPFPALSPPWTALQRHAIYDLEATRAPVLPADLAPTPPRAEEQPKEDTRDAPPESTTTPPVPVAPATQPLAVSPVASTGCSATPHRSTSDAFFAGIAAIALAFARRRRRAA